ncbi:flagellar brake protein [Marinospirillum insulare]|nr:flagellar brake protein [Marinospirillum insulare]
MTQSKNGTTSEEPKEEGQLIKSREGIYRLMRRLQVKHTPLKLRFDSVADHYTSMVLAVNFKEGYILLDEVTPKWGDELMAKAIPFHFDSYHDGCKISAEKLQAVGRAIKEDSPVYKVLFPTELHFLQRRQFFRASVRLSLNIQVRLGVKKPEIKRDEYDNIIPQSPTWEHDGLLRDLSAQGCQIEAKGDLRETLPKNTEYTSCYIIFPNGHLLDIGIAIRHVGYDEKRDVSSLGCQLINMDPKLDRKISFIVNELQRDNARSSSGNSSAPISELFLDASGKEPSKNTQPETEEETKELEKLTTEEVHHKAVRCVQKLVNSLRDKTALPIDEAWEVTDLLLEKLQKDRQELLLISRVRSSANYLYEHSVSVAVLLADQTMFNQDNPRSGDPSYLRDIIFAGLCHDLGKGLIPDRIVNKSGELNETEAKVMHKHSLLTREVLSRQQGMPAIALTLATQNCERLDGSGHPEHLKGISISPVGKLAAVIDVFDAMTNGRSYRAGLPYALAYKRLLAMRDKLDLASIQQLIKRQGLYPIGSLVAFENGDLAFVKRHDQNNHPSVVRLVFNKNTNQPLKHQDLKLAVLPDSKKKLLPEDPAKYQLLNDLLLNEL